MADRPLFWSQDYVEAFVEQMNDDPEFKKAARGFHDVIVFRCLDHPSGEDIEVSYTIEDGEVVGVEMWSEDAPSQALRDAPFDKGAAMGRATAPYAIWVKLDRGEMNALGALTSPDYSIEGSKIKIMAHMGVLNAMSAASKKVDKTY